MSALRRHYGATPLHLLLHVALFAAAAWVVGRLVGAREAGNIALWFVGALVLHDLVLLPFYSALDRVAARAAPGPSVNLVRVPAALSALLFLLFFPQLLGRNEAAFARVAGLTPEGYLQRWLLVTAVLFAAAAGLYAFRAVRGRAAAG